jgi:hypothetical protein
VEALLVALDAEWTGLEVLLQQARPESPTGSALDVSV